MTYEELEEANRYQDFISVELLKRLGWSIGLFTSKHYQYNYGESRAGIEIKYDRKMATTGNIYIETHERHDANKKFVASGINRQDNTILWCIGDTRLAYILVKKQLRYLCYHHKQFGFKVKQTPTSIGVIIPVEFLEKNDIYVVKKLKFGDEKWKQNK
jgi:hypothetical protein